MGCLDFELGGAKVIWLSQMNIGDYVETLSAVKFVL